MKRVLFVAVLLLGMALKGNSQEVAEWRFGIHIQPTVSWFSTTMKEFENGKPRLNLSYGGIVEKTLKKTAVISTGFLISDFGGNYNYIATDKQVWFKDQDSVQFTSRKLKARYVELPVALKFRTPRINYLTYTAHFGLDLGFRVRALSDDAFRELKTGMTGTYDNEPIQQDVNFMKLGLNVGIGTEYIVAGTTVLFAEVSYINGFTNITRKESEILVYNTGARVKQIFTSNIVALKIGVLF
ncbi:MAG TPA: porin family protein [Bacteroidales bacterium]|nr:porin family protein [Bacteroidales bacterium]HRZ50329.1 porin family protein [Bacteroidales bacterium]